MMTPKRKEQVTALLMEHTPPVRQGKEITPTDCHEVFEYCNELTAVELRKFALGKYGEKFLRNINIFLLERDISLRPNRHGGNGRVSTGLPEEN